MATLLNIALFIPFGFFSSIVFKRIQSKWIYGALIGFIFSVTIEFLQTFTGRFVQVNDIFMNTLGTFIGYEIWFLLSKINHNRKKINNSYPVDYDNNL
ncbi:VanZ family protein [Romboutsia sedimentorum]|uniref:VanZ family protein n=1 Tax=Romboutsia sedimentorum TaxID=1368474 RepID=UPI0024DE4FAF|nr:VanZ family protein [Romboutsia sedimentorum]MDK2587242.1 VanZ family protein [Romboutsia sedimentorum]